MEEFYCEKSSPNDDNPMPFVSSAEPPTEEFPFFAMEKMPANEDGDLMQRFARDNEKGGIFLISILLSPEEWEDGHGARLLEALATFEVLQ